MTAVCVVVAGCGGGSDQKSAGSRGGPKTVAAWTAQFQKAVKSGDCKAIKALAPNLRCSIKGSMRGARVTGSKAFGSGAVVDFAGTHYPKQATDKAQMVLVQRGDGVWMAALDLPESRSEVGTSPPASTKPFVAAADAWTGAVAKGDCKPAFKYAAVNEPEAVYCKNVAAPKAQLHQVFAANSVMAPEAIGGTANIQFFRYTLAIPKAVSAKVGTSYATLPVIHVPPASAGEATNPYLAVQATPAPTPKDVIAQGPYTRTVRSTYVKNCAGGGESSERCGCEIDMIAAAVAYSDFKTPTSEFDKALPGIKRACNVAGRRGGTAEERQIAHVVLGGDLVPGYLCSARVSTEKLLPKLEGSRYKCGEALRSAPPDNSVELKNVTVKGDGAEVDGTDQQGRFTVKLVRQGSNWLVDDFVNKGS